MADTMTIERACEVLNRERWRGFTTWQPAPKFSPKFSVAAWSEQFQQWAISYSEEDAIRIARSFELEAELIAAQSEITQLKNEWAIMARACGNWRDFEIELTLDVVERRRLIADAEYQCATRAILERNELKSELDRWRDYFGCDSPHDTYVQDGRHREPVIAKEQARANRAENRIKELESELAQLRETAEYPTRLKVENLRLEEELARVKGERDALATAAQAVIAWIDEWANNAFGELARELAKTQRKLNELDRGSKRADSERTT